MDMGYDFSIFGLPYKNYNIPVISNIKSPYRKIICKSMTDDFYSNLIDWSDEKIFFVVDDNIFLYNFFTETTTKIFQSDLNPICSIKCIKQNNILAVGSSSGLLTYIDLDTLKFTRYLNHRGRISCISIINNNLITGSRDRKTRILDIRTKDPVSTFTFHTQEVCGISVNKDHKYISTGGNDNKIFVIDPRVENKYILKLEDHKAAIKALSWSPIHYSKFVSGGGSADKTLKMWDIQEEVPLQKTINYESQICNLKWLNNGKILSTFGYSNNDIKILKNFEIEKKFSGHKNRVIHFATSEDEKFFASGSGDSNIKIFEIEDSENHEEIKIR